MKNKVTKRSWFNCPINGTPSVLEMNPLIRRLYVEVYNEEQRAMDAANKGQTSPTEENIDQLLGRMI